MKYLVNTNKTVEQATTDLQAAVERNGFGVLHMYNLQQTLMNKGVELENDCRILEVCNPHKAKEVLSADMGMNMALPCRVSVYEEDKQTKIGMINPTAILSLLGESEVLSKVATEVEEAIKLMIDEAK